MGIHFGILWHCRPFFDTNHPPVGLEIPRQSTTKQNVPKCPNTSAVWSPISPATRKRNLMLEAVKGCRQFYSDRRALIDAKRFLSGRIMKGINSPVGINLGNVLVPVDKKQRVGGTRNYKNLIKSEIKREKQRDIEDIRYKIKSVYVSVYISIHHYTSLYIISYPPLLIHRDLKAGRRACLRCRVIFNWKQGGEAGHQHAFLQLRNQSRPLNLDTLKGTFAASQIWGRSAIQVDRVGIVEEESGEGEEKKARATASADLDEPVSVSWTKPDGFRFLFQGV